MTGVHWTGLLLKGTDLLGDHSNGKEKKRENFPESARTLCQNPERDAAPKFMPPVCTSASHLKPGLYRAGTGRGTGIGDQEMHLPVS
jgi:hypothetical protein